MDSQKLFANFEKHIALSAAEKDIILSHISEKQLERNDFLLLQGERCPFIYFVNQGTLRAYFLNDTGKDSTIMFAVEDWWITDMHCFLNELPAMVNIQAVERTGILRLSKESLDKLFVEVPAFNTFFRILMQNAYCREQLRMIQNLSLPALTRYENFMHKYPHIASKVPLKQIASYLGITPEFLSAIRSTKK